MDDQNPDAAHPASTNTSEESKIAAGPDVGGPTTAASLFGVLDSKFKPGRTTKNLVYHFCIDNRDWTLMVGPDKFEVLEGEPSSKPDCYLKTTSEILIGTVRGEYTPSFSDFLAGKIRSNNPQLLLTLKDIFSGE